MTKSGISRQALLKDYRKNGISYIGDDGREYKFWASNVDAVVPEAIKTIEEIIAQRQKNEK